MTSLACATRRTDLGEIECGSLRRVVFHAFEIFLATEFILLDQHGGCECIFQQAFIVLKYLGSLFRRGRFKKEWGM